MKMKLKTRMGFWEDVVDGIADFEAPYSRVARHGAAMFGICIWAFPDDGPPKYCDWEDAGTALELILDQVDDVEEFDNVFEAVWYWMDKPKRFEIFSGEDAFLESLIWAKREGVFDTMREAGMTDEQIEKQIDSPLADIPNNPE